jgi:excisionase family DNA binding protein
MGIKKMNNTVAKKENPEKTRFISAKEIADILEVTASWVYELLESNEIPNFKIKSKYFVERKAFEQYLENKMKGI